MVEVGSWALRWSIYWNSRGKHIHTKPSGRFVQRAISLETLRRCKSINIVKIRVRSGYIYLRSSLLHDLRIMASGIMGV